MAMPSDMKDFAQRMRQAAESAGGAKRLSEKTEISRRTIGLYLAGKADPSREKLVAIADAANVSVRWLATGKGPIKSEGDLLPEVDQAIRDLSTPGKFAFIPHLADPVFLKILIPGRMGWIVLSMDYIKYDLKTSPENLFHSFVSSDNMEPTLKRGDTVIIDIGHEDASTDGIYYINFGVFHKFNRLQRISDETIKLTDDNKNYNEPIIILKGERDLYKIIGKIVWFGRSI